MLIDFNTLVIPYLIFYGFAFIYLASIKAYDQTKLRGVQSSILLYIRGVSYSVVLLALISFFVPFIYISRTLIVVTFAFSIALFIAKEFALKKIFSLLRKRGFFIRKALILGDDEKLTRNLLYDSESDYRLGIDIVGLINPAYNDSSASNSEFGKDSLLKVVGDIRNLVSILKQYHPDTIIIYARDVKYQLLEEVVAVCEERGLNVWIKLDILERVIYRTTLHTVRGVPFISFHGTSQNHFALFVKYTFDRVAAAILLLLLAPILIIVALSIKLASPGPILFSQRRSGLNGREFDMLKFRSMVVNAEELKAELQELNEMQGPHFKIKNDPRITFVGKTIRKTSIDELPQLWNVLRGEMSLVGPRPMDSKEVEKIEGWHSRRLSMKPGITCIWQVAGRSQIREFDDWARMDLEYIDNWSLALDILLLLKTIPVVILGKGAS
ncbi:UNVERIFIED_CONTAM: hypothetical protein GTU68_038681 [Idotea baltica]|nr:hypothetical protein [Idotea baltica]